jgi:hypothetical protein
MKSKVIPMGPQKYDVFNVFIGRIDDQNQVVEGDRVGVAFLRGKSKVFSLRLWMFDSMKYFVAPDDEDSTKYELLSLEEYTTRGGEEKCQWHKVGSGQYVGNYLKLKFHLLDQELYLSLLPSKKEASEVAA